MKKWPFFAEVRTDLTGPLEGVNQRDRGHLGRTTVEPLSQLAASKVDQSTADAIDDWHYWVAQGLGF